MAILSTATDSDLPKVGMFDYLLVLSHVRRLVVVVFSDEDPPYLLA